MKKITAEEAKKFPKLSMRKQYGNVMIELNRLENILIILNEWDELDEICMMRDIIKKKIFSIEIPDSEMPIELQKFLHIRPYEGDEEFIHEDRFYPETKE